MNSIKNYLSASYAELRKVIWPTRKQALILTGAVIGVSLLLGVYLTAFSYIYQNIIQKIVFKS